MNFSAALEALRAGKKVRLPEMKDYFVYIATVYNLTNTSKNVSHIRLTNYKDTQDWTPSEDELLSEKWEMVDEYRKVKLYFKCPRCEKHSVFDKKFLLADLKGRDIIECENCGNKVEIVKKDPETKTCCGENGSKDSQYTLPAEYIGYGRWRVTKPLPVDEWTIKVRRDIENGNFKLIY